MDALRADIMGAGDCLTLSVSVEDKAGSHQPFCIADGGDGGPRKSPLITLNWCDSGIPDDV